MRIRHAAALAVSAVALATAGAAAAEPIHINGLEFESWQAYVHSDYFRENNLRCATPQTVVQTSILGAPNDCGATNTTIAAEYDPVGVVTIPVVVHILRTNAGAQDISDALVQSQIDIMNEDFLALAGTNGANGNYAAIQFQLATTDPSGNPTTGITRTNNSTWASDSGTYYNSLAWDTNKYLNIYTNTASGALGYVPALPAGSGIVGTSSDRVVILWSSFGRNAPIGPPYDQGRTVTHEVGHYFGLYHTFQGACAAAGACYNNGDYICDTSSESSPNFGCPASRNSCAGQGSDPYDNYMDYSDDLCMEQFTVEQVNRMRCTVTHWRPNLALPTGAVGVDVTAESRGFELLHQNVPNPFSPQTRISFELPRSETVSLRVMDVAGRTVRTLSSGNLSSGRHSVTWDGMDAAGAPVAAGVYFYRLETSQGSETRRMVKMK